MQHIETMAAKYLLCNTLLNPDPVNIDIYTYIHTYIYIYIYIQRGALWESTLASPAFEK